MKVFLSLISLVTIGVLLQSHATESTPQINDTPEILIEEGLKEDDEFLKNSQEILDINFDKILKIQGRQRPTTSSTTTTTTTTTTQMPTTSSTTTTTTSTTPPTTSSTSTTTTSTTPPTTSSTTSTSTTTTPRPTTTTTRISLSAALIRRKQEALAQLQKIKNDFLQFKIDPLI